MDRDLLLFTKDPQVELTTVSLLQGENLTVSKALLLDCALNPEDPHLLVDPTQLCYYNLEENSLVILDRGLNETRRIRLPDDVTSEPVISADLSHLYYCAGNEIRVLELESGLSRMLKQQECRERRLLGFHFGDTILETFVVDPNGAGAVDFVSAADGLSVGSDAQLLSLTSGSGRYLLQRQDGVVTETLVGDTAGEIKSLSLPAGWQCFEAFGANGVMMAGKGQLAFVSISSGKVTARVDLGDDVQISHAAMDPGGNAVWILGTDSHLQSQVLYRWDLTAGEVNENAVVLHERYSQENPDTAGIQAAANRAKLLADTYGLQIYVDNSFTQPEEYSVIPAFQGEALNVGLATLEATFVRMPEGFFDKLRSVGKDGMIHVALVRQILDAADAPVEEGGLHYAVGGDHYVLLTVGGDLENRIYRELSHVMDAAVYGGSKACPNGCLGLGDCEAACTFDAIHVIKGVAVVNRDKCTSCSACIKACPNSLIKLVPEKSKISVRCHNTQKGADARKGCTVACIGCGMCQRTCKFDAIHVENNLASIDPAKCKQCGMCVVKCPTGAIHDVNFPKPLKKEESNG